MKTTRPSAAIHAVASAWTLSLGLDLFLHGGLLARQYATAHGFLLPPMDAFRRIPFGYLAFLMLTVALWWLIGRLDVRGVAAGFRFGVAAGSVAWAALLLGLYSISTAEWPLLLSWWVGQAIELGAAGAVLGAAAAGTPAGRLWRYAIGVVVLCVAATVALQSLGWAPTMRP